MIVKKADKVGRKSFRAKAGERAESDMAFYLRRAFGDHRQDVLVFNDLRLEFEDEVAQIDHLVVHQHGMLIIETKSVSGEIHISPRGEFERVYGRGKRVGWESPVLQAKRQADLLRRLLEANKTTLRDRKLLGLVQGGFTHCPIEVRVAISDRGIVHGGEHAPEVRKADQICNEIESRIAAHVDGASWLNLDTSSNDGMYRFTPTEMERLRDFLLKQHRPKTASTRAKIAPAASSSSHPPTAPAKPLSQYICSKCQSLNLRIAYGKYGYYFKCQDCSANTWIDTRIDGTDRKGRIRKSGDEFFLICPDTGDKRLIFRNPPS